MFQYELTADRFSSVVDMKFNDNKGNLIEHRKVFLNPGEAELFIKQHLKEYLATKLRMYVLHAWKLGTSSHSPRYSSTQRTDAMIMLLDYIRLLKQQNLFAIALWVRTNQSALETVLPVPSNSSYPSSKRNMDEIIRLSNSLKIQTNQTF